MTKINSKNRTPARRLLNNWHDSRRVAFMNVQELCDALQRAINDGLITQQGVDRALQIFRTPPKTVDNDNGQPSECEGDANGGGESNEEATCGADDSSDSGDSEDNESEGESESEQETEQEQEPELHCHDCDKVCTQEQLIAGAKGTLREGEMLCEPCDDDNNKSMLDDDGRVKHPMLETVIKYLTAGIPVALVGPTGSGKSVLADMAFDQLKLDKHGCGAMLSKYDLIGFVDANGNYHNTPLFLAVTKGGGFCFDEMDASAPDAVVAFNAVTDGQKTYTFPHGQFDKHESLRVIACLNTYGNGASADYVGRYKQDAAAMNRYVKVFIDYDPQVEKLCGPKDIVKRCQTVRIACVRLGIRHIVSTRTIALAAKARTAKVTKSEIDRDIIFPGLDENAIKQIKAQMLKADQS